LIVKNNAQEVVKTGTELQIAGTWKRIAAGLFDGLLVLVLAVGVWLLLAPVTGYDRHSKALDETYAQYEAHYGVSFSITQEEYESLPEEDRAKYDEALDALNQDEDALESYNKILSLMLLLVSASLLGGFLGMEFLVPLLLKDGQTVGKKIFGLGLVRTDSVRVTPLQLFVRVLLGKFTVETMIPVYIVLMLTWGATGTFGTLILGALLLTQVILYFASHNHSQLHDLMAGTAVVDIKIQRVFANSDELLNYQLKLAAEEADRAPY
jgi:uncharacterized RDD family membrane protein YckC